MKITLNRTSCPVTAPSPAVLKPGFGWIPLRTELAAVKVELMIPGVNVRLLRRGVPTVEFDVGGRVDPRGHVRVEKVGRPEVRPTSESLGKTR